jgi:AraC family transcriptional regulator of adaptative response/methylated-DNA-[protein]-cysteine methyltransferase
MNQLAGRGITRSQLDDEQRWQATDQRDSRFDGLFVYAVRSTGIYCRPSCPSRRPRREQVRFFDDCEQAEQAGFRACRRCEPRQTLPEISMVEAADRYIDAHLDEQITLSMLGDACAVSPYHLHRTFKRVTGLTPRQYVQERRMGRLKEQLRAGSDVTTALYDAGFGSSSRLYESGSERLGMSPKTYRHGGDGVEIVYTIVDSPLGRLLVGTTDRGVCAVSIGDSDDVLEDALHREYPAAEIHRGEPAEPGWVDAVAHVLNGSDMPQDVPIDVQATAFQWRVWSFLRTIPSGETRSYGEVARALDQPSAARAVAQACATNPVALIVPCHRVVRGDGEVGGYRWGAQRKKTLLERERERSTIAAQPA